MISQKYVDKLLLDIRNAAREISFEESSFIFNNDAINDGEEEISKDEDLSNYFQDVEAYLNFDSSTESALKYNIHMDEIYFPKADELNNDQMEDIVNEMLKTYGTYYLSLDFPDGLPISIAYNLTIQTLDEKVYLSDVGHTSWVFCNSDIPNCPFQQHCYCIEYEAEYMKEKENGSKFLNHFINCCKPIIIVNNKIVHDDNSKYFIIENNTLFNILAEGYNRVPSLLNQNKDELNSALDTISKVFNNHKELLLLFASNYMLDFGNHLEKLLALECFADENGNLIIENFFIDNNSIVKGIEPIYTPEELINKLENNPGP